MLLPYHYLIFVVRHLLHIISYSGSSFPSGILASNHLSTQSSFLHLRQMPILIWHTHVLPKLDQHSWSLWHPVPEQNCWLTIDHLHDSVFHHSGRLTQRKRGDVSIFSNSYHLRAFRKHLLGTIIMRHDYTQYRVSSNSLYALPTSLFCIHAARGITCRRSTLPFKNDPIISKSRNVAVMAGLSQLIVYVPSQWD